MYLIWVCLYLIEIFKMSFIRTIYLAQIWLSRKLFVKLYPFFILFVISILINTFIYQFKLIKGGQSKRVLFSRNICLTSRVLRIRSKFLYGFGGIIRLNILNQLIFSTNMIFCLTFGFIFLLYLQFMYFPLKCCFLNRIFWERRLSDLVFGSVLSLGTIFQLKKMKIAWIFMTFNGLKIMGISLTQIIYW